MGQTTIITSGKPIDLKEYDPDDTAGMSKDEAATALLKLERRLYTLQNLLYGTARQALLVVLQGMDTAGKDGATKQIVASVNPVGCRIAAFKEPSEEEQKHDFLWRVHQQTPMRGMVAIFNRSQYEDVLAPRVRGQVPKSVWKSRYDQINDFEQMLTRNQTIIVKFFLHISFGEQKERLLAREDDPEKAWKLSVADWENRAYWGAYQEAYGDAIGLCGTKAAPWHIVAANAKWYRNYYITKALVDTLEPYAKEWTDELADRAAAALKEIERVNAHAAGK